MKSNGDDTMAENLTRRERRLIRACEIANNNPHVASIEQDLDMLPDEIPDREW
jgi:hypothetical protein